MSVHSRATCAGFLVVAVAVAGTGAPLHASIFQTPAPAQPQVAVTPATQTGQPTVPDLVAPIALYPDLLLGQVLTISATPQEVLDLADWLVKNDSLTGAKASDAAKAAGFSTSAQYLALFPQVVDNMAKEIDWTTELGDAYTADAKGVMAAIQSKRQAAVAAGNLKTSTQMTVTTSKAEDGSSYIEIAPTDPKVIYVPVYNPVNVYVTNPAPAPAPTTTSTTVVQQSGVSSGEAAGIALLSFGVGMAIGSTINNSYYPYPHWGYGMYYGGRPYYPPPYRPPYYAGYHPAYGYHPPANYHWNQVNRQTNVTINNNNYYNKFNNNSNNRNPGNANRPGQISNNNRPGGAGNQNNGRPGGAGGNQNLGNANNARPGAGGAGTNQARPQGGGDRGYAAGGGGASRPSAAPSRPSPQASRPSPQGGGGGAFGGGGGGSGSSARAASSRGRASAGAPRGGGGGGGRHR